MSSVRDTIYKLALENAIKFKGTANPKALIGHLIKEHPDVKQDMKSTMQLINEVVGEVNTLDIDTQKQELLELDPEYEEKKQAEKQKRKEQRRELPDLPNAEPGKVITRIPPEPSKYNHLGHAMSFLLNYLYGKKYDGKIVLRFDDTNPEKSMQDYVDAVFEDIVDFMQLKPDTTVYASDHMDKYLDYAQRLIDSGDAYVCSCEQSDIAKGRREMADCPHRNQSVKQNDELWSKMKSGELEEGSHVLRLKIDMQHKNAVMRDPVIYRLSYTPHYKKGTQYKVWPMYDFECAIEEGLCGVTHVLRSNEFDQRIELQNYIARLFGFPEVTYVHYGRYNIVGATTKGREIRELIESGDYIGWDDPRLVTIRALRRRGILRESFIELAKQVGLSKTQTNLDFGIIASINRNLLDKTAKRYAAIKDPVTITVNGIPYDIKEFRLRYNPNEEARERKLPVARTYAIERADLEDIPLNGVVRFIDSMNVKKTDQQTFEFLSDSYEEYNAMESTCGLIHFVPLSGDEVPAKLMMPDTKMLDLTCDPNVKELSVGDVIQFERFAFVRLDKWDGDTPIFWYTHE
ncbi:MAG: glutamate--tRNA ligase [Candidatus Woesearchaeota archaeon]